MECPNAKIISYRVPGVGNGVVSKTRSLEHKNKGFTPQNFIHANTYLDQGVIQPIKITPEFEAQPPLSQ